MEAIHRSHKQEKFYMMEPSPAFKLRSIITAALFASAIFGAEAHTVTDQETNVNEERPSQHCLMREGYWTCRDHSHCIQLTRVCDGTKDCTDNSDEGGLCHQTCATLSRCAHKCHPTPTGPYCLCAAGMRLEADNITCSDINECAQWPPVCSQLCQNVPGSRVCACAPGYTLADDLTHCHASQEDKSGSKALLVYTQGSSIMRVSLGHGAASTPSVVYSGRGPISAFALDTSEARVFWFSVEDSEVKAIGIEEELNRNGLQRIIKNGLLMANTMAYDWIGKNLYIGDSLLHRILVCSVISDLCSALLTSSVLHVPQTLTVDPIRGKLYWSECGTSRKIEVSGLDGSDPQTLVRDRVYCAMSLYIDQPTQILYWTDPELHLIESVSASGKNRRNYESKYLTSPVSLTLFEEDLFIVHLDHTRDRAVLAVTDKFDYESRYRSLMVPLTEAPTDIQVYHPALQTPGENPCKTNPCNGGLCLLTERASFKCACPAGRRLDSNLRSCIWSLNEPSLLVTHGPRLLRVLPDAVGDVTHEVLKNVSPLHNFTALAYDALSQTIYVAETALANHAHYMSISTFRLSDPNEKKPIVEDRGLVSDMAVDWVARNIYWTDSQQETVEMSRMDGSARMIIIDSKRVKRPSALAVDAIEGKLYYSDCGPAPHIGVCDLDGARCFIQSLGAPVGCVSDMFIDTRQRELFYTDSKLGLISVTDLTRFSTHQLRHSPEPLSLTLLAHSLFWVDGHYADILRHSDSYHDTRVKLGRRPLEIIIALDNSAQPEGMNGCSGAYYGGCSHVCIARSPLQTSCLCPPHMQLGADSKTCTARIDGFANSPGEPQNGGRKPINEKPRLRTTPPSIDVRCEAGLCLNNGACFFEDGHFACECEEGFTGLRCENDQTHLIDPSFRSSAEGGAGGHAWVTGVVVALVLALLIVAGLLFFARAQGRLRPGEVFRFVRLQPSFLRGGRGGKDPRMEKLINPSAPDMIDNIYTDVREIDEQKPPRQGGSTIVHSQSLDSVQSAAEQQKLSHRPF